MADYLTVTDLRDLLAGSEDLPGTAASLSDADLTSAIEQAQAEVDARFGVRYDTPFANPPQLVVDITGDIAAYRATLLARRGEQVQPNEAVALRYQQAEQMLAAAAKGQLVLPIAATESAAGEPTVANPVDGDLWTADDFLLGPSVFSGGCSDLPPRGIL